MQSAITGNPDIPNLMFSKSSVSSLVIKEVLNCFSKVKSGRVSVSLIIVGF